MSNKMMQRQSKTSILLKNNQATSIIAHEKRSTFLKMSVVEEGNLENLDLSCADFINCEISDTTFNGCDLRGASFRNSKVERVTFVNCFICDMELPDNAKDIAFYNCSEEPSGSQYFNLEFAEAVKTHPETLYGKMVSLIEATAKAANSLSTEKLHSVEIMLAFVTIIVIAVFISK